MNYRNCSSDRAALHQSAFENSLLKLMSEKKYSDITVTDIARQAGFSRKSFYHYFDRKDGCLIALVDHEIHSNLFQQEPHPHGHISITACLQYWQEHRALTDALYRNRMMNLLLERMLFFATVEDGFRIYVARRWNDTPREQVVMLVGGLYAVLLDWYLSGYEKDPEEIGNILESLLAQIG